MSYFEFWSSAKANCMKWVMVLLVCGFAELCAAQDVRTSDKAADWQTAAGNKMSFEVASIHLSQPGTFHLPSFALSPDDWFREPNGNFHADFSVDTYIEFAYKLWLTGEERSAMLDGLPEWIKNDHFTIQAKAPLHATKDQYRLMMQSLLTERFNLKLRFESKQVPVLAMTLMKAGKTGPRLMPHDQGLACDQKATGDVFPSECYSFARTPKDGLMLSGSRATSMELIGKFLGNVGGSMGEIGRPVVDETGLQGRWDFTLLTVPPGKATTGSTDEAAASGSTLLEAMQEQLGIKLKPIKAILAEPVIDHIERPTEN